MATELRVLLDTTSDPPVLVIPRHHHIHGGSDKVHWTVIANETFTFATFTAVSNSAFTNIVLKPLEITANYEDSTPQREDAYVITVRTPAGDVYSSAPTKVSGGGGGNATIKNN